MDLQTVLEQNGFAYAGGSIKDLDFMFTSLALQGTIEVKPLTQGWVSVDCYSEVERASTRFAISQFTMNDSPKMFVMQIVIPTLLMLEKVIG